MRTRYRFGADSTPSAAASTGGSVLKDVTKKATDVSLKVVKILGFGGLAILFLVSVLNIYSYNLCTKYSEDKTDRYKDDSIIRIIRITSIITLILCILVMAFLIYNSTNGA
jgi:cell division protein FtsX